jgi:hypothetical protein
MLSVVAGVSLVYDFSVGLVLLAAPDTLASWFGVPLPDPMVFVRLNAIFLMAVGLGFLQPLRDPERHRAYLWVFGPLLKGAGAAVFLASYAAGDAPASFLIFAASDGSLALATLVALLKR